MSAAAATLEAEPVCIDHGESFGEHYFDTPGCAPCSFCGGTSTVLVVVERAGWKVISSYRHGEDCDVIRTPCGHAWTEVCETCEAK